MQQSPPQTELREAEFLGSRYQTELGNQSYELPYMSSKLYVWLFICLATITLPSALCHAVTEEERSRVVELAVGVSDAGNLYAAGSFAQSAAKIGEVQKELIELLKSKDAALHGLLKPIYTRLVRAHGLLELEGAELTALPSWNELTSVPDTPTFASPTSVSFAKSIAPILTTNCQGCHIAGQQASGGLRMDTFSQLLRGGDSGAAIVPGNAAESLLIKKVKGESGDRMPAGGRPPLTNDEVASIATWINKGATFDGPSPEMNISTVIAQVWAGSASHRELFERRQQRSLERWTKVLPGDQPATAASDELFVLGNVPPERINTTLIIVSQANALAKKLLKAPAGEPLLKGGLTVFVLKSRYDYSEFGRMTESRELPKEWLGHWHADPLDAYSVLAADAAATDIKPSDKTAEAVALQIVVGAYLGAHSQVPTWFAEGVARNLVKTTFRRGDERINLWQQNYPAALLKAENAKTLLEGRLDEEAAGLVGMGLTGFLMERNNRRRFDQLLELLRAGKSFEDACAATFATPEIMVKTWLGK